LINLLVIKIVDSLVLCAHILRKDLDKDNLDKILISRLISLFFLQII